MVSQGQNKTERRTGRSRGPFVVRYETGTLEIRMEWNEMALKQYRNFDLPIKLSQRKFVEA